MIAALAKRAPELRHIKRWMAAAFQEPSPDVSNHLLAGWFATTGGGLLFVPTTGNDPYVYDEVVFDG